jgi:Flp pilus assembly protein TadB
LIFQTSQPVKTNGQDGAGLITISPVFHFQSWTSKASTGLLRLWDRSRPIREMPVSTHWVYALRMLIAILLGLTIQNQHNPPRVIAFVLMVYLVFWAVFAPMPNQKR